VAVLKIPVSKYGEKWNVTLYYQDSGIEHPGEETRDGTPFDLDEMREFRVKVQTANDDDAGQRSFNAHLSPRWPGMQSVNGNDIFPALRALATGLTSVSQGRISTSAGILT